MPTSPDRSRELLLALAAAVLFATGAVLCLMAPDALAPEADDAARTWLRSTAALGAGAAALVGAGLLFGRGGAPGRQLVGAGLAASVVALLAVVLGGLFLVVDDAVGADEAAYLGFLVAVPAAGAGGLGSGRLLVSDARRTRA